MKATITAALVLALAPAAVAGSAGGTITDPQPPGWQVPPGERGAAPNAPLAAPPPVEPEATAAEDRPKIELESLERDDED
jgi:hypothetical protein